MSHQADNWIASEWMNKTVKQVPYTDGSNDEAIGRISVVVDTLFDEKGALHCKTKDGFWCPASRLEIIDNKIPFDDLAKGVGHDLTELINQIVQGKINWTELSVAEKHSLIRDKTLQAMQNTDQILKMRQ